MEVKEVIYTNGRKYLVSETGDIKNEKTEKRDKQAPINARKGAYKNWKEVAVYNLDGELIMILPKAKGVDRFTYKGMIYRLVYKLKEKYGEIPIKIPPMPKYMTRRGKKIVVKYKDGKEIERYEGYPKYSRDYI